MLIAVTEVFTQKRGYGLCAAQEVVVLVVLMVALVVVEFSVQGRDKNLGEVHALLFPVIRIMEVAILLPKVIKRRLRIRIPGVS